ncbi:MAG: M3 family metallopeptidase, partial [Candidatus Uhrbacteria bacterium]|nr:M3 family metallopeptidase [Candidatus Uhrbacteria bacterium]
DPVVAKHRLWIEHARISKPYLLTEEVEGALEKRDPFGPNSWTEFFDELESDLEPEFRGKKKTLNELVDILNGSKNDRERAEALRVFNDTLKGPFAKYSAQTLYMVAGSGSLENLERNFRHPMEERNKDNQVPEAVVDALHRAVIDVAAPLARRYYRLKAAHLGWEPLKWSDRNAPLPLTDTTLVSFDQAIDMVLAAYESFSPTLAGIIRESIRAKHVDAPAIKGKRHGAFNYSIVLPGNKSVSFTFLEYLGSNKDVMTLAHELGHGVHGILAGQSQGALMSSVPMAYAETASTFGEMTTFNFLRQRLAAEGNRKSLLALLMMKIEYTINTMVRQISFSNFERRLHGMDASYQKWETPKKLSVEELNDIWLQTTKEIYGQDGDVFTYENTEYLWS